MHCHLACVAFTNISLLFCTNIIQCYGTAEEWIYVSFGGQFTFDNVKWDIIYLVGVTVAVRVITHIGLNRFNFLSN
jgi:hypothetical protein